MNEITIQRTPEKIGEEIRDYQTKGQAVLLYIAIEIGRRLKEAKDLLKHGEWLPWLKSEARMSSSTAANYMKLFDEYAPDQLGIFGAAPNFQALGNLNATNALLLLAVPAEEREEFVVENDVEHMTTRELDKLLKEKTEAEERATVAEAAKATAEADVEKLQTDLRAAQAAENTALTELGKLREENKELKNRPIEVAVERDEAAIEQAAREAEEKAAAEWGEKYAKLQKKLEKAEASAEKLKTAAGKAETAAGDKIAAAEKEAAEKIAAAEKDAAQARAELEKLQKELRLASPETTAFSLHFKAVQESFNELFGSLEKIRERDTETARKLTAALDAVLKQFSTRMEEGQKALSATPLPGQMELGG